MRQTMRHPVAMALGVVVALGDVHRQPALTMDRPAPGSTSIRVFPINPGDAPTL
jgi:hypothetical protein